MKTGIKILTHIGAALGLFAMLLGSAQALIISEYNIQSDWLNNVASYTVEDFEDNTLAAPLQSITGDDVSINGVQAPGKLWDIIDQGVGVQDTVFTFDPGVYGIGGIWDLAGPGGEGTSILVTLASGTIIELVGDIANSTQGFWGFTVDEMITSVSLAEGFTFGIQETYTLDNLMMANSLVAEPAILAMIGIGLVGIGFSRRKRNTAL